MAQRENSPKQFIYYWYKELGWRKDPFHPSQFKSRLLAGFEEERKALNSFILERKALCFLEGSEGSGKSSLISWLVHELQLRSDIKVLHSTGKEETKQDFLDLLASSSLSFKDRTLTPLLRKLQKKNDSFEELYQAIVQKKGFVSLSSLHSYLEKRSLRFVLFLEQPSPLVLEALSDLFSLPLQVIVTFRSESLKIPPYPFRPVHIELKELSFENCCALLSLRLLDVGGKNLNPFSLSELKKIYLKSKGHPVSFLSLCHERALQRALDHLSFRKNPSLVEDTHARSVNLEELGKGKSSGTHDDVKLVVKEKKEKPYTITQIKQSYNDYKVEAFKKK